LVQSSPRTDQPLGDRLQQDLKNDLIAGLLVVIPLATTIWLATTVSKFVLAFLTSIPKQFNPFNTLNPLLQELINLGVGLLVPLLGILLIGLMARNIVGRWLLEFGEGTLQRIPLAGSVYKTLKQLLETFLRDNSSRFRRVVLVEYPREGLFALGFVTGVIGSAVQASCPEPMLSVFIPTAPNPTTGWYAVVPERAVRDLDVYIEQPCLSYEECLAVRRATDHPFVLDETVESLDVLLRARGDSAMDVVNLKISKLGGLTKTRQARDLCVSMGIAMTLEDSWGGDITTAAIAHLAHSTPEAFRFTSTDFNSYVTVSTAEGAPRRVNGFMSAATTPGLGIRPRPEVLGPRVVEVA